MDSVHHIWCPLSSQEFQDLPDGAETTLTVSLRQISHRTGKVTSLPGVNYGDLKTFGLKRTGYGGLPSTQRPYRAASVQR